MGGFSPQVGYSFLRRVCGNGGTTIILPDDSIRGADGMRGALQLIFLLVSGCMLQVSPGHARSVYADVGFESLVVPGAQPTEIGVWYRPKPRPRSILWMASRSSWLVTPMSLEATIR